MKSGMVAAEAVFARLARRCTGARVRDALQRSWLWDELYRVRNIRPASVWGCGAGSPIRRSTPIVLRGRAPWTLHHHADHTQLMPASAGAADRLSAAGRQDHLRPAVLGVHLEHQPRGGPAGASAAARSRRWRSRSISRSTTRRNSAIVRPASTRSSTSRDRRAAAADQRAELRALQDLRHQGPDAEHRLGGARGRRRAQLSEHVSGEPASAAIERGSRQWRSATARWSLGGCGAAALAAASASAGAGAAPPVAATPAGGEQAAGSRQRPPVRRLSGRPAGPAIARLHRRGESYEKAIAADPDAPELISRTFLMEVCVGNFDRAARAGAEGAEARSERRRRPARADRRPAQGRRYGRRAEAGRRAAVGRGAPLHRARSRWPGRAWRRATSPAPKPRCRGSTNSTAFEPLKVFQLGLLYDFAGKPDKAQQYLRQGARPRTSSSIGG